ncbi:MAG: hypothetical protein QM758_27995 [Armatimonas sp.]
MAAAVSYPAWLLDGVSDPDLSTRQEAKRSLETFLQASNNPVMDGIAMARDVENERQARALSGALGRAINKDYAPLLMHFTSDKEGWVSSIARRAIRSWLENAAPADAAEALRQCLMIAVERSDSRTEEFICTATTETVAQNVDLAFRLLIPLLSGIVAQRGGARRNMSWLLGMPPPGTQNPFEVTLSELKAMLPEGDLPLPAENHSSGQDLPRPATGTTNFTETTQLPLPAPSAPTESAVSLWERLFGRRDP